MANRSKGERIFTGIRVPVFLLTLIKGDANARGIGLNDYLVKLLSAGYQAVNGLGHADVHTPQHSASESMRPVD